MWPVLYTYTDRMVYIIVLYHVALFHSVFVFVIGSGPPCYDSRYTVRIYLSDRQIVVEEVVRYPIWLAVCNLFLVIAK